MRQWLSQLPQKWEDKNFWKRKNLQVIHEFGSNHDTSDEQAMNVVRIDGQQWLPLRKPIEINIGHNEARRTAIGILENPLQIALNWDCRRSEAMEDRHFLVPWSTVEVVRFRYALEERRQKSEHLWRCGWNLNKVSHGCDVNRGFFSFSFWWSVGSKKLIGDLGLLI